jgi:hypothetical protein
VARVRREVAVSAPRLWAVVTDWPRHGRHLIATTLQVEGSEGMGQRVIAVSAVGRLRVEDAMEVTVWHPPPADPAVVRLDKSGTVLGGWAEISVRPLSADRSEIIWREQIHAAGATTLPGPLKGAERQLSGLLTRLMIGRLARRLARDAETGSDD